MIKIIKFLIVLSFFTVFNFSNSFSQETKKNCRINSNKQVLDFIKKELTPFKKASNDIKKEIRDNSTDIKKDLDLD